MPIVVSDNDRVLVDASTWVDLFAGNEHVVQGLAPLMRDRRVVVCGTVTQEVVQGSRDEPMLAEMQQKMSIWVHEAETPEDFVEAARLYAQLRSKGITIPPADCLIAAVAKRCGLRVCATDPHFAKIPGLRLFSL